MTRAAQAGATVRSQQGSMLVLKLPVQPTATVARFIQDLTTNSERYGVKSFHLSLADTEEVILRYARIYNKVICVKYSFLISIR